MPAPQWVQRGPSRNANALQQGQGLPACTGARCGHTHVLTGTVLSAFVLTSRRSHSKYHGIQGWCQPPNSLQITFSCTAQGAASGVMLPYIPLCPVNNQSDYDYTMLHKVRAPFSLAMTIFNVTIS